MVYVYCSYYVPKSYGISCMYYFVSTLNRKGIPTRILCHELENLSFPLPEEFKPYFISHAAMPNEISDEDVVIYSDIVQGNPMDAKRVIRWLMNKPGFLTQQSFKFLSRYVLVAYSTLVDTDMEQLFYLIDERKLFDEIKEKYGKHSKDTVTVYFGKVHNSVIKEKNELLEEILSDYQKVNVITRHWPKSRRQTLQLIAESDLLISYDCLTNLNLESTLAGTPVLMMDDTYGIKEKHFNINDSGFAYSKDEIAEAKKNIPFVYQDYSHWLDNQDDYIYRQVTSLLKKIELLEKDPEERRKNGAYNMEYYEKAYADYLERGEEEPITNIDIFEQIPLETIRVIYGNNRIVFRKESWKKTEDELDNENSELSNDHQYSGIGARLLPNWRDKTYLKYPGDLTFKELLFLAFRRLFKH